jgi:hypothetical protein
MNEAEASAPEKLGLVGILQSACGLTLVLAVLASPGLLWWPLAFVLPTLTAFGMLYGDHKDKQIAEARSGEGICEFARAFDRHHVDTWIIRATYQQLALAYPVRPTDNLRDDLGVCDEDLEDAVVSIADRAGRSLEDWESNPWSDFQTVRDLVMLFQNQPLLPSAR